MTQESKVTESAAKPRASVGSAPPFWLAFFRGVAGGAVGGILGYYVFFWLLNFGLYALVLPGALVGLGCGLASGRRSGTLGVLSALGALLVGALAEWRSDLAPLDSLLTLLAELPQQRQASLVLILVGAAVAFYLGIGRNR